MTTLSYANRALSLIKQKQGYLTEDLLLTPGRFGLGQLPGKLSPDATTTATCGYCATGCGLNIHLRNGEAVNLTPDPSYPVNLGMACPKGWEALSVLRSPERGTTPLIRIDGQLTRCDWRTAASHFAKSIGDLQNKYGPQSVAFLSTGQLPVEEMAMLGCLAKFGLGMIHGDGNTRQCMATAVTAYKESFGFDAPPYTYADFEESDVLVFVGSNLCVAHPIMWQRVLHNPHHPDIIVVDPRRTETAMAASQHLQLAAKSDLCLLYGVARILIEQGGVDSTFVAHHTQGFDEFADHVQAFSLDRVVAETGLAPGQIQRFADTIQHGDRVSFWWTMGVNQSYEGVRVAQAIINLALITGNIGRPGTGANSITGQCNAMGSRLFSNTTNLLGGHSFADPEDREKVAAALGIDPHVIPTQDSWDYSAILEGVRRGEIKGLWVICTNPAHSWIHRDDCRELFDRLEFLVVQDMYETTDTARIADLYLPAAGWGEKEGTFINSERRIGLLKKVSKAPGEALADFSIFKLLAHYCGCGEMFAAWNEPEDVFQSLKQVSRGQPCDISGIVDYRMIDEAGGIQWPFPSSELVPDLTAPSFRERRLFTGGRFYHADRRARLIFAEPRTMPERPNVDYPYLLNTGRASAAQWHTQTRTGQSAVLRSLCSTDPYVEINPHDATQEGIGANQWVTLESRRGRMDAKAFLTHSVPPGQVFVPMHYPDINRLTLAHFDPYSKQPSYKDCAVRLIRLLVT